MYKSSKASVEMFSNFYTFLQINVNKGVRDKLFKPTESRTVEKILSCSKQQAYPGLSVFFFDL